MTKKPTLIPWKRFLALSFLIYFSLFAHAQQTGVTIRAIDHKKEPVAFATISVSTLLDSVRTITKTADSSGVAHFTLAKNNLYTITITSVNFQSSEKKINFNGNQTNFTLMLEPAGKTLDKVVLTSQKPLIKQEDDKTIVDPENLVAASTSGYEVMEKTPGLFIDQDGNIYISSLTPATVQINGRDLKMSAADVATLLKSFPPTAIAKIEIVRTPSASYDASSTGGVVNVVLKKGFKIGTTGSVTAGLQQGRYGNQFVGFNFNSNNGKRNFNFSANYNRRNSFEEINSGRVIASDTSLRQEAFTKYPADAYSANYIYSFTHNKWEYELSGNTSLTNSWSKSDNKNFIEKSSSGSLLSNSLNRVNNDNQAFLIGNGFEARLKMDTLGSEWFTQVFHYYSHNTGNQNFSTQYSVPFSAYSNGNGETDNKRNLFSLRSDLKLKLKKKLNVEAGIKSTAHLFRNNTAYFKNINGQAEKDDARTNTFNYTENINALYVQAAKTFGKDIILKFGTRLENTNMSGHQLIPTDTTFELHRTDLFPYLYLSKNLMKIAGYNLRAYLVYRRTISRPVYEQLNPFPKYIDQYLSETGNPSLKPQFTQNVEANISVDEKPILAVGLNDTRDIFSIVTYQSDTSQSQAYRTYDNLGKNREWYFRGLGALPPGGKYFLVVGAQYNHNFYQGLYDNQPLLFRKGTWTFFTYQTFKIDKRSMLTLNGFLRLKGQQQLYEIASFGSLNASVNRKFLKEKLVVTLSASDIFLTNKNDFVLKQGSVNASGIRRSDSRRLGLNIRYNFGLRKKEEPNNPFTTDPSSN